jgi:Ca2+-dependent lipid-binding protein
MTKLTLYAALSVVSYMLGAIIIGVAVLLFVLGG